MQNTDSKEYFSGERLYLGKTDIDPIGLAEHMNRYELAKKYLKNNFIVLDAACGTGYGSEILAKQCSKVIGFEFSNHALQWAEENKAGKNLEYVQGDLNKILPFKDEEFDAIVSFETLEHIENQENMLSEFKRILKKDGILILSSPDREIITGKAHTINHFHINELSKKEFIEKIQHYFHVEELYGQTRYIPLSWKKKAIKRLAKLDIFKLRRKVVRALGVKNAVHKALAPFVDSEIHSVALEDPNSFFVLIAVCRKQ